MKLLSISIISVNGTIEKSAHEESPEAIQAAYHINEIIERLKVASQKELSPFHIYTSCGEFYYYLLMDNKRVYLFISNELASSQAELTRHFNDIAWIAESAEHKQQQKLKEKLAHPNRHLTEVREIKQEIGSLREEFFHTIDNLLEREGNFHTLFKKT
ncbi:MAG: hypothetical protein A3F14_06070 [Gammaproteobacteria bacterium RIFCSPHIGHO2_12_FULL_43_28]|nr:MAG: hypothetical protein A3F14_06070 [Gammaproteobacteria bacterium RIFCSPHIGHO2_12_FULL_43_28]